MTEQNELIARERETFLALEQIRAAVASTPNSHPTAAPLAEALALAEHHWQVCQAAVTEAAQANKRREAKRPGDYWSARWRT